MRPRDLLRVVAGVVALTIGPGLLSAACSSDHASGTIPPGSVGDDASAGDAAADANPPPLCTPPSDATARCSGSDARMTFFPPLQCASPSDGGSSDANVDDAGDAAPPTSACTDVSPSDTFFTPTACRAFATAESQGLVTQTAGMRAPTWLAPNDGDTLTADEWSIFAWQKGGDARRGPIDDALDFLEPSAHAFTPLAGDAYVLEFTVDCVEILRVALGVTSWTPDRASWAILTAQTKPVSVRVIAMKFVDDALASGTTPVASAPITFSMKH